MTYSPAIEEITTADATDAGFYLMYQTLLAVGTLAVLIIMIVFLAYIPCS